MELLDASSRTADANGRAVCIIQPLRAFENWDVRKVSVRSTSSTLVPTFKLYRTSESPTNFLEGTYSAQFNSSDVNIELDNGDRLVGIFENADVGASCTMSATGTKRGR